MAKFLLLLHLVFIGFVSQAQNFSNLVLNVDTINVGGSPGKIKVHRPNVVNLISNIECDTTQNTPVVVATTHGGGKVIGIGNPGALRNESYGSVDNLQFYKNILNWFSPTGGNIAWSNGWADTLSGSNYVNHFDTAFNFTSTSFNSNYTLNNLQQYDVLILGDDRTFATMNQVQLDAVDSFVTQGGSIIVCGVVHGWPGSLTSYPMNQIAAIFGFEYTNGFIFRAPFENNNPLFNDVYPNAIISNSLSKCYVPFEYYNQHIPRGDTLRILRLAVAVTGRYTQESGGKAAVKLIQQAWLDEINETYGREHCVRFELISDSDSLIYEYDSTDLWTDPGPNRNTWCDHLLDSIDHKISTVLGHHQYDFIHVIAPLDFFGGCGGNFKDGGVSAGFDIPTTRHEIGHQFGQPHTIEYINVVNYEPENGSFSMMGGNRYPYAHATSYYYTAQTLNTIEKNTGTKLFTGNTIPTVNAGLDYTIPKSTPYVLSATASDPDIGDTLSYVWDNMDRGFMKHLPDNSDSIGCLFARLLPRRDSFRNFPGIENHIDNVLNGATNQLPSSPRTMNLRVTVNDNHRMLYNGNSIAASGINSDDVSISVDDSGPFEVTSQSVRKQYQKGDTIAVRWKVNGTDLPPIATSYVRILLSIDGGYNFNHVLLDSTANDGGETVLLPGIDVEKARIKVEAIGNIFYSINSSAFPIGGRDLDGDGFTEFMDCDDSNPNISPITIERLNNEADENCDQLYGYSGVEKVNFEQLFVGVDSVWAGESASVIEVLSNNVVPIIAGDVCIGGLSKVVGVGALYQKGRVIGLGQENFVTDRGIDTFDNKQFFLNVIHWLNQGQDRVVGLVDGFFITAASLKLKDILTQNGYKVRLITSYFDAQAFNGVDVIIDLNNWRDRSNVMSQVEINFFIDFVKNGGGALLGGSGFSWPFPQKYTMNQMAEGIGFRWTKARLIPQNNNLDGYPYFKDFFPTSRPLCSTIDADNDGFFDDEDCDDNNPLINPSAIEVSYNGIDDDCNAATPDDDLDGDGFLRIDDCNDTLAAINPYAVEIPGNGIDEDCDSLDLIVSLPAVPSKSSTILIYPNPADQFINVKLNEDKPIEIQLYDAFMKNIFVIKKQRKIYLGDLAPGVYVLKVQVQNSGEVFIDKIIVTH